MKLSAFTLIATLGLASQVAASPVTVYILSPENAGKVNVPATAHMRWGLAAANTEVPVSEGKVKIQMIDPSEGQHWRHGGKSRFKCQMRAKAMAMANWMRQKVGLPLIETRPVGHVHKPGFVTILESAHQPHLEPQAGDSPRPVAALPSGQHIRFREGKWAPQHRHHHEWHAQSFSGRLNKALMTLGPWEGRVVAFVLGCGIGSLLRMLYVLTVVTYRSFRPKQEVLEATEIDILFEEAEDVPPPPVYYNDEKIAFVEDE